MKRIYTSIMTLLLLTVALGTGVFAWFTINTRASADGLSGMGESADGGFYISLNGTEWTTELDLTPVNTALDATFSFKDVTWNGTNMTFFNGDAAEAGIDYIEFELHFLTGTKNRVFLQELLIETDLPETSWIAERTVGVVNAGDVMKAKMQDAMRVSFHTHIFENKADDTDIDTSVAGEATFGNTIGFTGFAHDYYNAMYPGSPLGEAPTRVDNVLGASGVTNTEIFKVEGPAASFPGIDESFTKYGSIYFRVWLEGWDGQAFNAVAGGKVNIGFKLMVSE